eukprot:3317724-Amphidinium_carterae.1
MMDNNNNKDLRPNPNHIPFSPSNVFGYRGIKHLGQFCSKCNAVQTLTLKQENMPQAMVSVGWST